MDQEVTMTIESEFDQSVDQLVKNALIIMENKYGLGKKEWKPYHNESHVQMAMEWAEKIAVAEGDRVSAHDRKLLEIAMAYHDIDSSSKTGGEENSANTVEEAMREVKGFSEEDIRIVREIILATRFESVEIEGTEGIKVMKQLVAYEKNDGDPSEMADRIGLLKKIGADADLANIGLPDVGGYIACAFSLGRELGMIPMSGDGRLDPGKLNEFWQWQAGFLGGIIYRGGYYTHGANALLDGLRQNHRYSLDSCVS